MPIPTHEGAMLPLLEYCSDQKEHALREVREALADVFKLTEDERRRLLPSGKAPVFYSRIHWARTYLVKAELLESPRRGFVKITQRGLDVLSENPSELNAKYLERYPEFMAFKHPDMSKAEDAASKVESETDRTPAEVLEEGYQEIRSALASELLDEIKGCSPEFFEKLVVDLLVRMGYGGSRQDAGRAIGRSGDGGIDGIIKEDRLGLDIVYIQAKRWENTVGRPEIQKFAGALQGCRARKGVFITTSGFSRDALDYAKMIDSKIALVDGQHLAELMIDHNLGVDLADTYEIKKIDLDYFSEE